MYLLIWNFLTFHKYQKQKFWSLFKLPPCLLPPSSLAPWKRREYKKGSHNQTSRTCFFSFHVPSNSSEPWQFFLWGEISKSQNFDSWNLCSIFVLQMLFAISSYTLQQVIYSKESSIWPFQTKTNKTTNDAHTEHLAQLILHSCFYWA